MTDLAFDLPDKTTASEPDSTSAVGIPLPYVDTHRALGSWTPLVHGGTPGTTWIAIVGTPLVHPSRTERALFDLGTLAACSVGSAADEADNAVEEDRTRALAAFDSLKRWLNLNDGDTAALVGISARSVPNWRNQGQTPYPSTVRRLHETHNLVAALVRHLGLPRTRVWLQAQAPDENSRLESLRSGDVARVTREASSILFPVPRPRTDSAADDDIDDYRAPASNAAHFKGKVRAARRTER